MVQVVPQFEINQQFTLATDATVNQLRALLIGPDYAVRKYEDGKEAVLLGAYAGADLTVAWPGRQAGEVVDQLFTTVRLDDAALRYLDDETSGTQNLEDGLNHIRNTAINWVDKPGFPRTSAIPCDVKVGDIVRLTKLGGGATQLTSVTGFVADEVAADIDDPVADGDNEPDGGGYTQPLTSSAGTYTGTEDTVYIVRCTTGGDTDGTAKVTFSTSTNVDAGGPYAVTDAVAVPLGSLGVTITFGGDELKEGDVWTINVTAATEGAVHELILANNVIEALWATNLETEIAIPDDIVVNKNRLGHAPELNWEGDATEITLKAGILATHARTGSLELDVILGTGYVSYRALRTADANVVHDIDDVTDVADNFAGLDDPDCVLSYGCYRALSNAAGTTVKAIAVASDDVDGYLAALGKLKEREDFYRIVPLTHDEASIDACIGVANQRSGALVGRWTTCMMALALNTTKQLQTGMATIDGTSNLVVHDDDGLFITNGVRPGDKVRALYTTDGFGNDSYSTFTVDAVLSEEEVRLLAGPASPVNTASTYEVWRDLNPTEQVVDWGTRTRARSNRRVTSVFPPNPGRVGTRVASYFLACSLAALRGASAPHQGLSNAEVLDWDDLKEASETFGELLDEVANYGGYIVTQAPDGRVYIRKQLTTDLTDTKRAEDSATVNLDSISYFFKGILAPSVGRTNVVQSNLDKMEADIIAGINEMKSSQFSVTLGGQVTDGSLVFLRPHATLLDRVVARMQLNLPIPLNNGTLDIIV
jgi:hypothetical protein